MDRANRLPHQRDFMVSALAIRRLLDAHKISDALRRRQIPVTKFPLAGTPPDLLSPADVGDAYDFANGSRVTLTIVKHCQQFIHSFVFTFSCDEAADLFDGVYVASDFDKGKFLYRVAASDYITTCRDIGVEDVQQDHEPRRRRPDGRCRSIRQAVRRNTAGRRDRLTHNADRVLSAYAHTISSWRHAHVSNCSNTSKSRSSS